MEGVPFGRFRRKTILIPAAAALLTVAVIATVTVLTAGQHRERSETVSPPRRAPITLAFTGLNNPSGVAVDGAGDVYITDSIDNQVLKLAGGGPQTVLPFTGLSDPIGVAVDGAGNVYVADYTNSRVVKLAGGASAPTVLPFTGLDHLYGVAVDGAGSVYVTESNSYTRDTSRVAKLAGAAGPQTELPLPGLKVPYGVAVDGAGSVYVADYGNQQVVKLPAS